MLFVSWVVFVHRTPLPRVLCVLCTYLSTPSITPTLSHYTAHTHTLQPYRYRHTSSRLSAKILDWNIPQSSEANPAKKILVRVSFIRNPAGVPVQLLYLVHANRQPLIRFPPENPLRHIAIICINHLLLPSLPSPFTFPSNDIKQCFNNKYKSTLITTD